MSYQKRKQTLYSNFTTIPINYNTCTCLAVWPTYMGDPGTYIFFGFLYQFFNLNYECNMSMYYILLTRLPQQCSSFIFPFAAETSLALLRHPDYCISGYSSVSYRPSCLVFCCFIILWCNSQFSLSQIAYAAIFCGFSQLIYVK